MQLTWETVKIPNYSKVSKALGIDFVKNPDLVMKPEYAYSIMAIGMHQGWFTGKSSLIIFQAQNVTMLVRDVLLTATIRLD